MPTGSVRRVTDGILFGVSVGILYTLLLTLFYVLSGGSNVKLAGVSYWRMVVWYFAGGALAGGIVGFLRPFTGRIAGRMLTATVAAVPVTLTFFLVVLPGRSTGVVALVVSVLSVVFGCILGAATWIIDHGNGRPDDPENWRLRKPG